eukprot:2065771-Amphidinium_carterae.1
MNQLYANKGRQPNFPRVASPTFNPDAEFNFTDHGRSLANDAQQALDKAPGVPSIITTGQPAQQQRNQLNDQNVQMLTMTQPQTQYAQITPTPMISTASQPMHSSTSLCTPPGVVQPQSQLYMPQMPPIQYQPQMPNAQDQFQMSNMQCQNQPAPMPQPVPCVSGNCIDFNAMWNNLLPGKYAVLIPEFRNNRIQRDVRIYEEFIPQR